MDKYSEHSPAQPNFRAMVELLVAQIPAGRVMTYGQLAAMCGNARAARVVGGVAHYGDPNLPWHRVVNRFGGLADGYPGGQAAHGRHLEQEGIKIDSAAAKIINFRTILWVPPLT